MLLKTKDSFALPRALAAICCCTLLISQSSVLFGQTGTKSPDGTGSSSTKAAGAETPKQPDTPPAKRTGTVSRRSSSSKEQNPGLPPLAQMLATALQNNPDLGVATSQVREAEAQLKRTRLNVVQQVMELRQAWETQRQLVAGARERVRYAQKEVASELSSNKFGGPDTRENNVAQARSSLKQAEMEVIQAQAKLAAIEAKIPYLLGTETATISTKTTGKKKTTTNRSRYAFDPAAARSTGELGLGGAQSRPGKLSKTDIGGLSELRSALDDRTDLDFQDQPLSDVMDYLREFHNIRILMDASLSNVDKKWQDTPIDLTISGVSLRAALQAFNDNYPKIAFVVRDYGLLVTRKGNEPEDAVSLEEFWKSTSKQGNISLEAIRSQRGRGRTYPVRRGRGSREGLRRNDTDEHDT